MSDGLSFSSATIVIPCYNEEHRLDLKHVVALATLCQARVLLINDGSTDETGDMLSRISSEAPGRVGVHHLHTNLGKGEAVRRGLQQAISEGAEIVAYCDADFATPPGEIARLIDIIRADPRIDSALGSRVAILGSDIDRSPFRHYTGRVFATLAAGVLGVPVYDTQCGAKAFRVTSGLNAALTPPFRSRWVFDVELLGRLFTTGALRVTADEEMDRRILEVPLRHWREPGGSGFRLRSRVRAVADLTSIARALGRI